MQGTALDRDVYVGIIGTARELLRGGARSDASHDHDPLDVLLGLPLEIARNSLGSTFRFLPSLGVRHILPCIVYYSLIHKLTKLLLMYGAKLRQSSVLRPGDVMMASAADLLQIYESSIRLLLPIDIQQSLRSMVDRLADMFHMTFLAGIGAMYDETPSENFVRSFVTLAVYSSQPVPGHSETFIRLVLNTLSATHLSRLRDSLYAHHEEMTQMAVDVFGPVDISPCLDKSLKRIKIGCEWVDSIVTPFSLKHLARTAIVRAMSHKSLGYHSDIGIGQYILFHIN